jgi:hypothetical protein
MILKPILSVFFGAYIVKEPHTALTLGLTKNNIHPGPLWQKQRGKRLFLVILDDNGMAEQSLCGQYA